jgi:hypothetical protein
MVQSPSRRCQFQPLPKLKHILTIKNSVYSSYLKKILEFQPECKPIDRLSHGYSETKVQNEKSFYMREKYRYKKNKEEKMAMDKILLENITASRIKSNILSLKQEFIASQQLKRCMLLYSDGMVFQYIEIK